MSELALMHLGEETWGERFERARARAGLSLREAAEKVSQLRLVSSNTLGRLEARPDAPKLKTQRQAAYIAALAYKVWPSDFDLTEDDRPPWATDAVIRELRMSTTWEIDEDITAGQTHLFGLGPARLPGIL